MNKNLIIAASALAIISTAPASADAFNGLFAGVQAGWSQVRSDAKVNGTINGQRVTVKGSGKNNAFVGGFHLGYSHVFSNNVYLGTKFDLDFRKKTKTLDRSTMPGADVELGYKFNNVVAYGKAGLAVQKFELNSQLGKHDKTKAGLRLGGGAKMALSENFSFGPEYTYTRFGSISQSRTVGGLTAKTKIRPEFHTVMARLSYSF